jgi:hypothetical protein
MEASIQLGEATVPHYAWVLAGRHPPSKSGAEPGPRAEFEAFIQDFGGELLSVSELDGRLPIISKILKRAGMPRLNLANLVQFWIRLSTAAEKCARWRRNSVPVGLIKKGLEALLIDPRCEPRGA